MMSFDVGLQGYDKIRGLQFYNQKVERVQSVPGVKSAAITNSIPLGLNYNSRNIFIEGQPVERGVNVPTSMNGNVGARYFETMGTTLLAGREFSDQDTKDREAVAVVNETFVKRLMPFVKTNADALNRRFSFSGGEGPFVKIVGVAADGKYWNIAEEPRTFVWTPISQDYNSTAILVVRTQGPPETMFGGVRQAVQGLDPDLPLFDVKSLAEHMRFSLFPAQIAATVLGVFGLVALLLSAIGIYGITSYAVAQRTREIGIRMALGAQLRDVLKLVLRHSVLLTLAGLGIGVVGAFILTRMLGSVLYGVSATDPLTFSVITLLLSIVALVACYIPARRAAKVDPLVALRE
jgi:predicted permease